ncbi:MULTISPECIES: hypothetical protein [Shewanella]|uniref:hypothetical protein n=1 Tax=Shewanella TaxID=22 RepID=UPI000A522100|nr:MULTISPECIES: hypothetical protein [Shewanella]
MSQKQNAVIFDGVLLWVIYASVIAAVELPLFNRYGEDAGNALLDLGNALLVAAI